jgi:hypothetical protein
MITPPSDPKNPSDILAHLEVVLNETSGLLKTLIDLERRDVLAPERLLHATDGAIESLMAWRGEIRRHLGQHDLPAAPHPPRSN